MPNRQKYWKKKWKKELVELFFQYIKMFAFVFIVILSLIFLAEVLDYDLLQAWEGVRHWVARRWYLAACQINQWWGRPCPCLVCQMLRAQEVRAATMAELTAQVDHQREVDAVFSRERQERARLSLERLELEEEASRLRYQERRDALEAEVQVLRQRLEATRERHRAVRAWLETVHHSPIGHNRRVERPMFHSDFFRLDSAGEEVEEEEEEEEL